MTYKIVTQEARTFNATDIVEDVGAEYAGRYVYYVFLGRHVPYSANNDTVLRPEDSETYKHDVYDNMLFGKKPVTMPCKNSYYTIFNSYILLNLNTRKIS